MFAPPDPAGAAALHVGLTEIPPYPGAPPASQPLVLPTLPSAASTVTTVPAPTLPAVVADPGPPVAVPYAEPNTIGVLTDAPCAPNVRPAVPAPLIRTRWLRRATIFANLAVLPGAFVGDLVAAALVVISGIALVVWSGVIATNARRARPATRHGSAPHPAITVLSWFVAPVAAIVAAVAIAVVGTWVARAGFDQQGSRTMVLMAAVGLAGFAFLIAAYQPYRLLAKCAKWVNADGGRFRWWFGAPIAATILAVVIQVFAGLVVLSDSADGSPSSASIGAVVLLVLSFTLPWLAWLVFGSRAMRSLEAGVEHAHGRTAREAQDPDAAAVIAPSA